MRNVFVCADNIYSPLGVTTEENFARVLSGASGIIMHKNNSLSEIPFYASLFSEQISLATKELHPDLTRFEGILVLSIHDALAQTNVRLDDERTVLILSTTKGNVELLELSENSTALPERANLFSSANQLKTTLNCYNQPIVVSNACISGILAMITAKRLLQSGQYDHAVVAGADLIGKFVLSGFQSFQAISDEPCKPFDQARKGINLGEAAGTVVLSVDSKRSKGIKLIGGAVSNDANHISGPSRTGEELGFAINKALKEANLSPNEIDFVSAHGTATIYNDEMEAKAFSYSKVNHAPVNSLKGYYGHTLGAAGIIETILSMQSMKSGNVIPTKGFQESGTSSKLNIYNTILEKQINYCLKSASGFGGCNAAIILQKIG